MRLRAKTDANHRIILNAFRAFGFSVHSTHRVGDGFPDCVIARNRRTALVEIKVGEKQELKPKQKQFHDEWRGVVLKATSISDVEAISRDWLKL